MATPTAKTTSATKQNKPQASQTQLPPWLQSNLDQYKMQQATLQDLAKQYGFDYSPEYANRIAEAEAQAKRTGLQQQLSQLDANLKNFQQQLDQKYFLNYMNQAQNQANRGLNAGIEADQNVRLAMNKQNDLAQYQRQDQVARNSLYQQLQDLQNQQMVRAQNIYQERLQQAFQNSLALNAQQLDWMQLLNQQDQFNRQMQFDYYKYTNPSAADQMQFQISQQQLALAERQLQEQIRQFDTEQQWREYTYNNMSAAERAQLDWEREQFGEEAAWEREKFRLSQQMAYDSAILGNSNLTADQMKQLLGQNPYASNFYLVK